MVEDSREHEGGADSTREQQRLKKNGVERVYKRANRLYGIKCVGRIVTKSMSKICDFWRLIVGDCDYAES